MPSQSVIIVGGGWAGLSAAVALSQAGLKVTLLEAGKQLGGRARSTAMGEQTVDNGQHLMLGAYTHMLDIMRIIGIDEHAAFERQALNLNILHLQKKGLILKAPKLPAPLHLLAALLCAKGLSIKDKIQGALSLDKLMKQSLTQDCSVSQLLTHVGVPSSIQDNMLKPLCIAALNTAPNEASAEVFITVLREAFKTTRSASDLLIPRQDLDQVLSHPAKYYIEQQGGEVILGARVTELAYDEQHNRVTQVHCANGVTYEGDFVIAATPYNKAQQLLKRMEKSPIQPVITQLDSFEDEPIITLYYQFSKETKLPNAMTGLLGGYSEWVFDRAFADQDGLMAVVISATGPHLELKMHELKEAVLKELHTFFPHLGQPLDVLALKEPRATFKCSVSVNRTRPSNQTPLANLFLAGDYTDTTFPATLEGAVRSGLKSAKLILAQCKP